MTSQEFSDQFDLLWNNITSNQAPGLDNYEKSVFLTKAQDEILKSYFSPKLNKSQEGFDGNERRQIDFTNVLVNGRITSGDGFTIASETGSEAGVFSYRSGAFTISGIPTDILMMVNETLMVTRNSKTVYLAVIPISYIELNRVYSKPYKRPAQYQAWRLLDSNFVNKAYLLTGPNDEPQIYYYRYVKKPYPIILEDFADDDNVSIDGYTKTYETYSGNDTKGCELDSILHQEILQRAVELAKGTWAGDLNSQLALGTQSETNMGITTNNSRQS